MTACRKRAGFTLIELILYVAISSVLVVSLIMFSISIGVTRSESEFDREVLENSRLVLDLISGYIQDAPSINGGSYGTHPSSLTLDNDSAGTHTIDTSTKTINGQVVQFLQIDGVQLTSDKVNITNFVLTDLTRGTEPDNIQVELTVESLDSLTSMEFRTSLSLREQ